ncbi:MAG: heterodisulfide reductase-related iron-sulfur binding cluster, partial [Anaerolineales bacterium]
GRGDSGDAMRAAHLYRAATEVTYYHGLISRALGEWNDAEQCMNEVLPEYRKLGSGEAIEYQLAQIKVGRGQVREGLEQSRQIEAKFYGGAFRPKLGVLQRLQAECLHTLGDTTEARRLVDESIADLMDAEVLGAGEIKDFSSLSLLAFDACLQCGRCEEVCPATRSGLAYSPRSLLLMLREGMAESLLNPGNSSDSDLNPGLLEEEFLWSCTTCGHCLDVCPAFIRPPEEVIDIRRAQVLMTGEVPGTVGETLRNFERQGNPWGMPSQTRMSWAEGLDLKILSPGDEVDVLYFVGCAGSFDDRNRKVTRAFIEILNKLEVDYGVLGDAEMCCGETARRMGNEYLFQVAAEENIKLFGEYKFQRIVTLCPHGLNTLKHEYPRFGGNYQVQHGSEFLAEHLSRLRFKAGNGKDYGRLTFHDSCYLGRYNDIYAQPRALLDQAGHPALEMVDAKGNSFCCGGGGGAMWLETAAETRINRHRLEQALDLEAKTIATACPYCLIMFDDALRSKGLAEEIQVLDVIEILHQALD